MLPLAISFVVTLAIAIRSRAAGGRDLVFALGLAVGVSLLVNDSAAYELGGGVAVLAAVARFAPALRRSLRPSSLGLRSAAGRERSEPRRAVGRHREATRARASACVGAPAAGPRLMRTTILVATGRADRSTGSPSARRRVRLNGRRHVSARGRLRRRRAKDVLTSTLADETARVEEALRIVHLLAATVWVGGTVALVFVAVPPVQRLEGDARARMLRDARPALASARLERARRRDRHRRRPRRAATTPSRDARRASTGCSP